MSATGKPLSLLRRKGSDLRGVAFGELNGNLLELADRLEESAGAETSSDDKPANAVGEVKKSVHDFDFWRLFQENRGFKLLRCVEHNWPSLPTRQAKVGVRSLSKSLTAGNRQTAENAAKFLNVPNCVELTHVKSGNGLLANDNWHPLDAA